MWNRIQYGSSALENRAIMLLLRAKFRHERGLLQQARALHEKKPSSNAPPLVSITIATYNRADILVERTLPTVFAQTHQNFEVIIVGDHCTDNTAERIAALNDNRVRFINLVERGNYPTNPKHRWMVAGTPPINRALQEAKGEWIAHLDDDDSFEPMHLEEMLAFAQHNHFEMVYSKMNKQIGPDEWVVLGAPLPFARRHQQGTVPHSAAFFRGYLKLFEFDIDAWRYNFPGDKQMWLRMEYAGVRAGFYDKVTVASPLRPNTTLAHEAAEDRD